MFERIFRRGGSAKKSNSQLALPDPMDKFPHPKNKDFFEFLVRNWQVSEFPPDRIYTASPHPEIVAEFDQMTDELTSIGEVRKSTMYGVRLAVTPENLTFAWAQGTHRIFVRLPQEQQKAALMAGGRLDATYPPDWIEFLAWGGRMRTAEQPQWRHIILHWMQVSYDISVGRTPTEVAYKPKTLGALPIEQQPPAVSPTVTVTLTATRKDFDSLIPTFRVLLGHGPLRMAANYIQNGRGVIVCSDKTSLSVTFPKRSLFGLTDIIIRGNLPEIMVVSEALAAWVGSKRKRKARLEMWDKNQLEANAQTPEEVHAMFRAALESQKQEGLNS